jgi:ABC-2 type transport system ATP-binding protein
MTHPAIETKELSKRFGDVTAVDSVDLTVESGEIFGFLGPNGAGKSTTINVLLDFVKPTSGMASMLGLDVSEDRETLHNRIGVVPENYGLYDRLSGRRHVELAAELKDADDDPDELLDRVGLSREDANRPAGDYSTGMGQRLALAMALVGDPDLLILDEPTSGLDPNGARELRNIIRDENERGVTVFFSSHILEQVEAVADRVGIMNEGALVAVDSIDRLRRQLDTGAEVTLDVDRAPERDLGDLPNVREIEVADGSVRATCLEPAAKLHFIDRVREITTVTDVRIEESSLEDLFASYTGEDTTDSQPEPVVQGGVA